ncbi:hypothetical protein JCM31826_18110 [Thermaurantimonas aggregans]|uniref:Glycosyltransferase RgtA/B/C/D-like domain-containing protein n=1 Tax=Thermaurantimonas aggregans TaxID=2173829 RepID=A0A401XMT0_9FLAO|nr:hypothetical protein [Thermaurantimonas aggregans]MCX8149376.1 hypothetical protein [Thermaurantimonas aggregans]GCD78329.1 hypothetical protein JCM31826_18110 [Thermaurantimonas aggregans]
MSELRNSILLFIFQISLILLKIPYLLIGFGPEEDAWGHVYNIIEMYEQGHYIISRLPGHPAYEALMFLLFPLIKKPFVINLFSAFAAAFAINEFYKLLKLVGAKDELFWTLAFGLMPAFFLGSTYAIDYAFSIWWMLRSTRLLFQGRFVESGFSLGVATAFRITSFALVLPAILYFLKNKSAAKNYFSFLFTASFVATLFYALIIYSYGIDFFDYHKPPSSGFLKAFYKLLPGALGLLGTLGFMAILSIVFFRSRNEFVQNIDQPVNLFFLVTSLLFFISYVRLPEKTAFAVPMFAYLYLFLAQMDIYKGRILLIILVVSIFILGFQFIHPYRGGNPSSIALRGNLEGQSIELAPFKGLYFSELEKRKNKVKFAECAFNTLRNFHNSKAVVVCGWWYAQLKTMEWISEQDLSPHLVYYLSQEELDRFLSKGYEVYHLEELSAINDRLKGTSLQTFSKPIQIDCP